MSVTAAIRKLLADGFTMEQALAAAEAFEDSMAPQRTARQERNHRYYEKKASEKRLKASEPSKSDASVLNKTPSRGDAHVEDNLPTKNQDGKKEGRKETRASDEAAFRSELAPDLPDELLDGVIKVRRDKRGQVTGLAARCFRDDAAECGMSVHDAAKACVTSSWITVKPHYFHSRAGPPNRKRNYVDVAMDRLNGKTHGPEGIFSTDGDAQRLPAGSGEHGPDDGNLRGGLARRFLPSGH